MWVQTKNWKRLVAGFACGLGVLAGQTAHAGPKPTPLKVGQTAKFTLDKGENRDYSVSLSKGAYRLVWDAERIDGNDSNIMGGVRLLKPNGVVIDSSVLTFNEIGVTSRVGSVLNVIKPYVARFRVFNEETATNNWFTVVPVKGEKRVPFGWGAKVTPARISADNGVGGSLEPKQALYHSITLPKGKWSISLGLELPKEENTNLMGTIDLLDTFGFTKESRLVNVNEIGNQARKEGIVTVTKPTPYLLRVKNGTSNKTYTYDVTIAKAE